MQEHDDEVPSGAIAAAMEILETLHGADDGQSPNQVLDDIMPGMKIWGPERITEGFGTIVYIAAQQLKPNPATPDSAEPTLIVSAQHVEA